MGPLWYALLFPGLAAAILLAVHGWMTAAEALSDGRRRKGEVTGRVCFAVVHTLAGAAAWYALAFLVRP